MLKLRRKTDKSDVIYLETGRFTDSDSLAYSIKKPLTQILYDYVRFILYCALLAVPLYAITISVFKKDWIMVIIDALIVPVGFIHGLLLLFGFVT